MGLHRSEHLSNACSLTRFCIRFPITPVYFGHWCSEVWTQIQSQLSGAIAKSWDLGKNIPYLKRIAVWVKWYRLPYTEMVPSSSERIKTLFIPSHHCLHQLVWFRTFCCTSFLFLSSQNDTWEAKLWLGKKQVRAGSHFVEPISNGIWFDNKYLGQTSIYRNFMKFWCLHEWGKTYVMDFWGHQNHTSSSAPSPCAIPGGQSCEQNGGRSCCLVHQLGNEGHCA